MTARVADLELRPATLDDAAFAADLFTDLWPDHPEDPVLWRNWWEEQEHDNAVDRHVARAGGADAGLVFQIHAPWDKKDDRIARVNADLRRATRTAERLDALFGWIEERAQAGGADTFTAWMWEQDEQKRGVVSARGYAEERRERFWELDLVANRDRLAAMAEASRDRMRAQGIRVLTLAEDTDPERMRKLWRMSEEASRDVPRTGSYVEQSFEAFQIWLRSPGLHQDRIWIARQGDAVVGISVLSYPPVRGIVSTDWTGTARSVRGKGVARALKCETVMQAIALGTERVRTDNDGQNAPILHLNESMGYRRLQDMVMYLRKA